MSISQRFRAKANKVAKERDNLRSTIKGKINRAVRVTKARTADSQVVAMAIPVAIPQRQRSRRTEQAVSKPKDPKQLRCKYPWLLPPHRSSTTRLLKKNAKNLTVKRK